MKNEVATKDEKFNLLAGYNGLDDDMRAELSDEMEDLDDTGIIARKVKLTPGGVPTFQIEGETEDDVDVESKIRAVIVFTHRINAFWENKYGEGDNTNQPPTCSSMDGKTGFVFQTGEKRSCDSCPYNQFVDGVKQCKNMRRIYMLLPDQTIPYMLSVPPTSIKDVNKALARILASGSPYTSVVVEFSLKKAENKNSVKYCKIEMKKVGALEPDQVKTVIQMRNKIKQEYTEVAITSDDYTTTPAQNDGSTTSGTGSSGSAAADAAAAEDGGFMNIPDEISEELPFE